MLERFKTGQIHYFSAEGVVRIVDEYSKKHPVAYVTSAPPSIFWATCIKLSGRHFSDPLIG